MPGCPSARSSQRRATSTCGTTDGGKWATHVGSRWLPPTKFWYPPQQQPARLTARCRTFRVADKFSSDDPLFAVVSRPGGAQIHVYRSGQPTKHYPAVKAGAKVALRFAVGWPRRRGAVWRLWAAPRSDELYLASRPSAGEFKVSMHESGDWRAQIVNPSKPKKTRFRAIDVPFDGRILARWRRPEPNNAGWIHALGILVPEHHLIEMPFDNQTNDILWHQPPEPGQFVELHIYLVHPNQGSVAFGSVLRSLGGGRVALLGALELAGGQVAVVLAIRAPITDIERINITSQEAESEVSRRMFSDFDSAPHTGPRLLGWTGFEERAPRLYDLAYHPRPWPRENLPY